MAPSPGRMTVLGAEVRLNSGAFGDGYLGFWHIDAKNILVLADALEVLHSFGGWQFKQNMFGVTFNPHTGAFRGDGPDLVATVFRMLTVVVDSPPSPALIPGGTPSALWDMSTKKFK